MAAIAAARAGGRVTVCERLERAGTKLLASGGGRCNFTNTASRLDFAAAFGRQGRFVLPAWDRMDPAALRLLLADLGVASRVEDGFGVFPASNRSADVLGALLRECARLGVEVRLDTEVAALRIADGRIAGAQTARGPLAAECVVIAGGGKACRDLGGTGAGYALARQAGHTIVAPVPALVPLVTRETWPASCSGVSLGDARVWIDLPRHRGRAAAGAVLFTHRGLSGPAVLDLSGTVAELLAKHQAVPLRLQLLSDADAGTWRRRFDAWQRDAGKKHLRNLLAELLPRGLAGAICGLAGDVGDVRAAELPREARDSLAGILAAAPLTVTATEGLPGAMVTRGGVALKHVDPDTLASRLVDGLHFAGEVLDLDGPCGGYNLHWCLASGHLAGASRAGATQQRRRPARKEPHP